jgi:hypothetical protein
MVDTVDTEHRANLPEEPRGRLDGVMSVAVKTEKGYTLTRDHGFTIEEEDGKILAFDIIEHPELGVTLLFGNQVFALKFWDDEDLKKGLDAFSRAVDKEMERRHGAKSTETSE